MPRVSSWPVSWRAPSRIITGEAGVIHRAPAPRIWYVVINGHQARILHGLDDEAETVLEGPDRTLRDTLDDRPTRSYASAGSARSAVEPGHDPLAEDARRFLRDVFERLDRDRRADAFDALVLVGAPGIVGIWRETIPGTLAPLVQSEVVRNLVPLPAADLRAALADLEKT